MSVVKKTCVFSGGTSGLGLEAIRQLLSTGQYRILLASRNEQRAKSVISDLTRQYPSSDISYATCDLERLPTVRSFAAQVKSKFDHVDLLVCNAGVLKHTPLATSDGYESVFQTNHLSHFLLCHLLLPNILRSTDPRIVLVASELHRRAKPPPSPATYFGSLLKPSAQYQGYEVYSLTKLYNVMLAYQLAKRYQPKLTCVSVTPGFVPATGLSRDSNWFAQQAMKYIVSWAPVAVSIQEGARRVVSACTTAVDPAEAQAAYFAKGELTRSSDASHDAAAGKLLWDESCQLLGIGQFGEEGGEVAGHQEEASG